MINGDRLLRVTTGCAPLEGPANIAGETLTVTDILVGAIACDGEASDQQRWLVEFLRRPIEQSFDAGTLTWKSGTDTLTLKTYGSRNLIR